MGAFNWTPAQPPLCLSCAIQYGRRLLSTGVPCRRFGRYRDALRTHLVTMLRRSLLAERVGTRLIVWLMPGALRADTLEMRTCSGWYRVDFATLESLFVLRATVAELRALR